MSALWREVQRSEVSARIEAVAEAIVAARSDVVALQEVARYEARSLLDPAELPIALDFLELLLVALSRRGVEYRSVAAQDNVDLALPDDNGRLVRFTDRDVILARDGIETGAASARHFSTLVRHEAEGGVAFSLPRGWVAVDLQLAGERLRIVNTHLENAAFAAVQQAQARELAAEIAPRAADTVLVGDLNSSGETDWGTSYRALRDVGLTDAWISVHGAESLGATCCFSPDLRGGMLQFRIDVILHGSGLSSTAAELVGAVPSAWTASGRAPSDHAGVLATLVLDRRDARVAVTPVEERPRPRGA